MSRKRKVLLIYTGGTIGMINNPETGKLSNVDFNHIYDHVPELKRLNINLETVSFEKPIDSSEITISHWQLLADLIESNYPNYDGFVILHGSDTMAYTASALSFMLEGLQKPVILTGSQLPIGTIRTDGKENLITAIEIAAAAKEDGSSIINEVAVHFESQLYRGNRCTKDSAEHFEAFRSPNFPELAEAGVSIKYNWDDLYSPSSNKLIVKKEMSNRVALLKLYPGIDFGHYESLFNRENIDGIVIESFGSGNTPTSEVLKTMMKNFIVDGGVVLNITQCNSGEVQQGLYEASSIFSSLGVVSGKDLTSEAAITKMMFVLANYDKADVPFVLAQDLRGEITKN